MTQAAPSINVTRWGNSGPEVLMIHGGPQGSAAGGAAAFATQQPLSENGWQIVLPDRPGHAGSASRGAEDIEVDARWVAKMLPDDGAHLVGHSYGGCIALAAARSRPQAVRSLTLIEAPVFAAAPNDADVEAFRQEHEDIMSTDLDPIERVIRFGAMVNLPQDLGPMPAPEEMIRMGEGLKTMRLPTAWDGGPAIAAIADAGVPGLIVTGGWSPAFETIGDQLAEQMSMKRVVIKSGHHFVQVIQPEFNEAFEAILEAAEQRLES
jgi:pimeloyl-ACP methyl ester carboxylesterase